MEVVAAAATVVAIALSVLAYRQKRARVVATASAAVATLATAAFVLAVHVVSYQLPQPPRDLAVGTVAADFVLPDEAGNSVALASMRGRPTLLVFYRGAW
jgi:cytochrome oxidase Cu insertion factor (SCO1/SenC/PrrC family)